MINWLIGTFQRVQSAINTMIYRVNVPTDTIAPTIVISFVGR